MQLSLTTLSNILKMSNFNKFTFLCLLLFLGVATTSFSQDKKEDSDKKEADKKKKSISKIKPLADIITEEAKSDTGLFTVHQMGSKYFFEMPNDLLDKELLIVSRISGHVKNLNFGGAGMKSRPQQVVRWQKHGESILLRSVSYNSVASNEDPIYKSLKNNNFEPIIMTFPIAAYNSDTTGVVFDVSALFTTDVAMIGPLRDSEKKRFGVKALDKKRSLISYSKAFPKNVEVRHILTFNGDKLPDNAITKALSIEMNQSFIELPEEEWQPRYYDDRVGYFSIQQTDYSANEQKAFKKRYITRWRLEPSDWDAYNRGELVEPVKPIVYYIDPGTPDVWKPYIKQGVNDWQKSFEKAGFKNAIYAKDAPTKEEDPDWSPEDVRYSVIRYITTDIQNAQGPHVHDPRTGEILESDILWYHNVMNLLRNWFMMQTAAINPEARSVKFKDEVMGELIRFVAAHEVGHTLGLPHNMGSSPAYPVDSLRSPSFTHRMGGTAPSIMDYARFNYIAQPEDGDVLLYPGIGPYDDWSIIYGYKLLNETATTDSERSTLNDWIKERADNPLYRYGAQRRNNADPSAQTEDLGDDAMYASELGIKNLQRILPNLMEWSQEDGKNYDDLAELYRNIYSQLGRYMGHVTTNIGGVYDYRKSTDQAGDIFSHVPKAKQKRAVNFLNQQLFQTPNWLIDKNVLNKIQNAGALELLRSFQVRYLNRLFDGDRLNRLSENEALNGATAYSLTNLMDDTRKGIFAELKAGNQPDAFRRNLQRAYISKMAALMKMEEAKYDQTDIKAAVRANLNAIKTDLKTLKRMKNTAAKAHFEDIKARIETIFE